MCARAAAGTFPAGDRSILDVEADPGACLSDPTSPPGHSKALFGVEVEVEVEAPSGLPASPLADGPPPRPAARP